MPRELDDDDDWAEESAEDWGDDDDDAETVPCPHCRREVYEDAERCPNCGRYISAEDAPRQAKPWWIIVGVVLCLIVTYFWVMGR
jgi:hypothetical protein